MNIDIGVIFEPKDELIEKIDEGLTQFNLEKLGGWECHHIAVVARKGGKVIGGIFGTAMWDWFEIDQLWVDASERHKGIGSQLLQVLEGAAVTKGFTRSHIRTGDWQALTFYEKYGYAVFGELEDYPQGHTTYFLKKIELG
jgi:GNAT superfamily N-acetyltransferase